MFKLAIVDDEKACRDRLLDLLNNYKESQSFIIEEFDSGNKFLSSKNKYDFIFLDIELQDMLGVDLAVEFRKSNNEALIIFTTSHKGYVSDAFRSMPFQYLIKPISEDYFHQEIDRAINMYRKKNKWWRFLGITKNKIFF